MLLMNLLVTYLSGGLGLSRSSSISSTWRMKLSIALKFLRVCENDEGIFSGFFRDDEKRFRNGPEGEKDGCRPAALSPFHEVRLVCRQFSAAFQHAVAGKVDSLQHSEFMERVCGSSEQQEGYCIGKIILSRPCSLHRGRCPIPAERHPACA